MIDRLATSWLDDACARLADTSAFNVMNSPIGLAFGTRSAGRSAGTSAKAGLAALCSVVSASRRSISASFSIQRAFASRARIILW